MNRRGFLAALGKAAAAAGALGLAAKVASPAAAPVAPLPVRKKGFTPPTAPAEPTPLPAPNPVDVLKEQATKPPTWDEMLERCGYKRTDVDLKSFDEWKEYCAEPITLRPSATGDNGTTVQLTTTDGTTASNLPLEMNGSPVWWVCTSDGTYRMRDASGNWCMAEGKITY